MSEVGGVRMEEGREIRKKCEYGGYLGCLGGNSNEH